MNHLRLSFCIGFMVVLIASRQTVSAQTGTASSAPALSVPTQVRVQLMHTRYTIPISCTGDFTYSYLKTGKTYQESTGTVIKVKPAKNKLIIGIHGIKSPVIFTPVRPDAYMVVNRRRYRGSIILRPRLNRSMDVIEKVDMDGYLYGVLPREVDPKWPIDALKAQAVVSRTYVVANLARSDPQADDVTSDVFSQVYGGLEDESPASNRAVDATHNQVLLDSQGNAVQAFFHSSCGGHTESPQYVWKGMTNVPAYMQGVPDPFCQEDPYRNWKLDLPESFVRKRLKRAGYKIGRIRKITMSQLSPAGRTAVLAIADSDHKILVPSGRFRLLMGADQLRSTYFTDLELKGKTLHFEGHGWGHGVGFCQWGARGRALAGQGYNAILSAYFPGTHVVTLPSQKP